MRDLFFLTCGRLRVPALALGPRIRVSPFRRTSLSVTVAVVVRDDGSLLLVDAGWSEEACAAPIRELGLFDGLLLRGIRAEDSIRVQLGALGFDAARVRTIVATHMHFDHVGGVRDFPNAEVVCETRELAAYRGRAHPGYRAEDLARAGRVRTIALAGDPAYGFPASFDLFDDGEIVLLDAHGHTRGSLAVALRSPRGCFVHVGDAAFQRWEYGVSPAGPSLYARVIGGSRADMTRTYACLRSCEADPRHPRLVPSHDATVFESLPHAPRAETSAISASAHRHE